MRSTIIRTSTTKKDIRMTIQRLLLVDSKTEIHQGIEKAFTASENNWQVKIASTGAEAISELGETTFSAVISELRLPDISTVELMEQVSSKCPDSIRFIISSGEDKELILKLSGLVHQFVPETCEPEMLVKLISNSMKLRELLADNTLHARIAGVRALPSPPEIYNELVRELQSESASTRRIADLIKRDVSITARMLQMVNSAFFGLQAHVENPLHAVNLLGLETVKSLVLAAGVFSKFKAPKIPGFSIDGIYSHSLAVGTSAKYFANAFGLQKQTAEDALMAGMLHDIGKLVMLSEFQQELQDSAKLAKEKDISLHDAERELLGVTHVEIGAYLLSLWGLPDPIIEAVALHCEPRKAPSPMMNALTAVHIAFAFDRDRTRAESEEKSSALDTEYLDNLNLTDKLKHLQRMSAMSMA